MVRSFEKYDYTTNRSGAIALSPDGKQAVVSGKFSNEPVILWDLLSRKQIASFPDLPKGYGVTELEFNPNGKKILARISISKSSCETVEDRFVLLTIGSISNWSSSDLFALDRDCIIFPPILSRFTNNNELFIFNVSAPVSIFDANTGQHISINPDKFETVKTVYDVATDGNTAAGKDLQGQSFLVSLETGKEFSVPGEVLLLNSGNRLLVYDDKTMQWYLSENGETKCYYDGLHFARYPGEYKLSTSGKTLVVYNSPKRELQVWDISSCGIIDELPFD